MNQRFPDWLRLIVGASALIQLGFGVALMAEPALIGTLWPWTMPPLTTRILAASTLVSVPLALLSIGLNRFAYAAIPFVDDGHLSRAATRGRPHASRSLRRQSADDRELFRRRRLMLAVLDYGLWMGWRGKLPAATTARRSNGGGRARCGSALDILGIAFVSLGAVFFVEASQAPLLWLDAKGITPLTARLFASPLVGLGLGLMLVSRATDWRAAAIPAVGMCTIGIVVLAAFALGHADFSPRTALAWIVASTPVALFAAGATILLSRRANRLFRRLLGHDGVQQAAAFAELEQSGLKLSEILSRHCRTDRRRSGLRPAMLCGMSRRARRLLDIRLGCIFDAICVLLVVVETSVRRLFGIRLPDRLHEFQSLVAQNSLHAADGVALAIEQMMDAAQQVDVIGPVIAPAAARASSA